MYEAYWRLRDRPFEDTIDPRFFFRSETHGEAFARLLYLVEQRKGGGLLTGVPGVGKTLVARSLAGSLPSESFQTAITCAPHIGALDVVLSILASLGDRDIPRMADQVTEEAVMDALHARLRAAAQAGRHPVVILDDADMLGDNGPLDMCRRLMDAEGSSGHPMTLILVGNLDLQKRVANDPQKALDARLAVKCRIAALTPEQSRAYILHRLQMAGAERGVFTDKAAARVVEVSGGVPSRINRLCDMALLTGYGLALDRVGPEVVDLVMDQIGA